MEGYEFPSVDIDESLIDKDVEICYVFLDVVGFTKYYRNGNERTNCIRKINTSIADVLTSHLPTGVSARLIPTGDGVCIALLNIPKKNDLHLVISNILLENIRKTSDIKIRIGVGSGKDRIIFDVNGQINFLGDGINTAARIMDFASPNQITISSSTVKGNLEPLFGKDVEIEKKYMGHLFPYLAKDKHGYEIEFYTYKDSTTPRVFLPVLKVNNIYQQISIFFGNPNAKSINHISDFDGLWRYLHSSDDGLKVPDYYLRIIAEFASGDGFTNRISAVSESGNIYRDSGYQRYIILMCVVYLFSWGDSAQEIEEFLRKPTILEISKHFSETEKTLVKTLICTAYLIENDETKAEQIFREINLASLSQQNVSWVDVFLSTPLTFAAAYFDALDTVERLLNVMRNESYFNGFKINQMPTYLFYGHLRYVRTCIFEAPIEFGMTPNQFRILKTVSNYFEKTLHLVQNRKVIDNLVRVKTQYFSPELSQENRNDGIAIQNRTKFFRKEILKRFV